MQGYVALLLLVQSWGMVAVFWTGKLIWNVSRITNSSDLQDNPFAVMLSTQISPGSGLYMGLIGGLVLLGAIGFVAVRRLLEANRIYIFLASQVVGCGVGLLVAAFVAPDHIDSTDRTVSGQSELVSGESIDDESILVRLQPHLSNKRFDSQDYEEFIWFDIEWTVVECDKPVRAIKGKLHLQDLFGETKLALNWTLTRPPAQDESFTEEGVGFKYNQFIDSHDWVLATPLDDMTARFETISVVYEDGTQTKVPGL